MHGTKTNKPLQGQNKILLQHYEVLGYENVNQSIESEGIYT